MSYLINRKNIVKYLFTQNIDGLELKAKIPSEKIVFAHGSFFNGHCARCNKNIDISLINKGISNGTVVYCECGGCRRSHLRQDNGYIVPWVCVDEAIHRRGCGDG